MSTRQSVSKITEQAANVALGTSRALTSHVRHYYEEKYRGRWRFARCLFALDATLLLCAAILVGTAFHYASLPVPKPGLAISLSTPPVRSGVAVPLAVTVRSADGQVHQNVKLRWHLSPGSQVMQANPPIATDGTAYLGIVAPGQEVRSHVVARFFLPPNSDAEFTFSVIYSDEGGEREFVGTATRRIESSPLNASVPVEFQVDAIASKGVVIPLRIENPTNDILPSASLTIKETGAHAGERIALGDLQAHDVRWLFVPLRPTTSTARLVWSIGAAGRELSAGSWEAAIFEEMSFPEIEDEPVSHPGTTSHVTIDGVTARTALATVHPYRSPSAQAFDLMLGQTDVALDVPTSTKEYAGHEWLVAPVVVGEGGVRILGPATIGVVVGTFPLATQVRYLSSAGDQLGVGPHPPRVGAETRYWVFWTIGPIDTELSDVSVNIELPPQVEATGNVSAVDGGSFSVTGKQVEWSLPRVGPAPLATGQAQGQAMFGFEIRVIPGSEDVGAPMLLMSTSTAQANDVQTTIRFTASEGPKTTRLLEDRDDPAAGVILPSIEL